MRAVALLLPVLLLAGCASPSTDDAFMSTVRESNPELRDAPDEDLIALGHQVCELFEEHGIEAGFPELIKQWGSEDAATIGGASVGAYCPEYEDYFS